jgi:hypothetical protein
LTLTRTQYPATVGKAGKGNPSKYADLQTPAKPSNH